MCAQVAPGAEGWNSLLFTSSVPKDQLVEQGHVGPGRWVTIEVRAPLRHAACTHGNLR